MPITDDEELELLLLERERRARAARTSAAPEKKVDVSKFPNPTYDGVEIMPETLPLALRVGLPLAGTPFGPAATAPLSGAGESLAQLVEDGSVSDPGAVAKATTIGAIPAGSVIRGAGKLASAARIAEGAAKFGVAEVIGETARRGINDGELRVQEALRGANIPAMMGAGFSGLGELGRKVGSVRTAAAERTTALAAAGVEKPTLDLIMPAQAALVNRIAQRDPKMAQLRIDGTRPLYDQFAKLAEGAPMHEEVFARLRPYVGKLDGLRSEVAQLEQNAAALRDRARQAAAAAQVGPAERAAAEAEATVAELNAVNAKARMLHEANANLGGFMDHDSTAQQFTEVVGKLFETRKAIGAQKFAAAGIPEVVPIFDKAELLEAARRGLSRYRGTDMEKRILGAIEDAGGAEAGALTLQQFRELRENFSARFAGVDSRQLGNYEAAGRMAYGSLTDASKQMIAAAGGNLPAYEAAVGYWRETAEAAASRYARPLLSREPSESTFQTLAADLASGKKAEVRAFNEFVAAVAQEAPDVARLAAQQLTSAMRNSFLGQARTATGIDTKKLTDSLLKAQATVDIGALGFGSAADIRRWADTFKEFGLKNVSEADFNAIFSSPQVQEAVLAGKPIAEAMRPAAARAAFEENVRRQMLHTMAGNKEAANRAAADANRLADAAELTVAQRREILAQTEADPIAQAFAGRQDWGIPSRPGGWGDSERPITSTMMRLGPDEGLKLVRALRAKDPVAADLVERRVLADKMQFFRPANTPGHVWALNKSEVQKFFHPAPGSAEAMDAATVRAMVGPAKFEDMKRLLKAVEMVHDVEKSGGILSTDGSKTILTSSGLARGIGAGVPSSVSDRGLRAVTGLVDSGRYHTLSLLVSNKPFAAAFWKAGGDVNAALTSMGTQRAALLYRDAELRRELEAGR